MRIVILHDYDCPLGDNGMLAFHEAADALCNMPPEARQTEADLDAIDFAWRNLKLTQVCTCGASAEIERRSKLVTHG